jgi:Ni,Fe-hydrogenase I cytochrome b subunit
LFNYVSNHAHDQRNVKNYYKTVKLKLKYYILINQKKKNKKYNAIELLTCYLYDTVRFDQNIIQYLVSTLDLIRSTN